MEGTTPGYGKNPRGWGPSEGREWRFICSIVLGPRWHLLGSSAMVFSDSHDPATLEALACREAMALAQDLSLRRIVIACDYKIVVEEIHKGSAGSYSVIIKEIEASARDFDSCAFVRFLDALSSC